MAKTSPSGAVCTLGAREPLAKTDVTPGCQFLTRVSERPRSTFDPQTFTFTETRPWRRSSSRGSAHHLTRQAPPKPPELGEPPQPPDTSRSHD